MNDSRTVAHRDIVIAGDKKRLLPLLFNRLIRKRKQRLVLLALEIGALEGFEYLISRSILLLKRAEHRIAKSLREIIGVSVRCLHLHIGLIRVHAERNVRRERPRRSRPRKNVRILALHPESGNRGFLLDILVALSHLM